MWIVFYSVDQVRIVVIPVDAIELVVVLHFLQLLLLLGHYWVKLREIFLSALMEGQNGIGPFIILNLYIPDNILNECRVVFGKASRPGTLECKC